MMNFEEIKNIMEAARKTHFTDKGLSTSDGIYYMNGNDGTEFDYGCNNRVCEFYIFKPNEKGEAGAGLIKFLAEKGGTYTMYVYDYSEPYGGKFEEFHGDLTLDVYELACYLQAEKDDKGIWDSLVQSWVLEDSIYIGGLDEEDEDDYYEEEDEGYDECDEDDEY